MLFAIALAAAASSPCTIDRAVYRQRGSAIAAQFQPIDAGPEWPTRLAVKLTFGNARAEQWWLAWNGGSAGGQFLASTGDIHADGWHPPSPDDAAERPRGDVSLIAADVGYTVRRAPLAVGARAPAHLLIPELREAAWYGPDEEARADESGQFFDLVGCGAQRLSAATVVTGDFDRDGSPDQAFVRSNGPFHDVVVRRRAGETVIFRATGDEAPVLSTLPPGTYATACAKGLGAGRSRCAPRFVTSTGDTLQFGTAESAQAAVPWSGRNFDVAWLSD